MLSKLFGKNQNNIKGTLMFPNDGTCNMEQVVAILLEKINAEQSIDDIENGKYNIAQFYDFAEGQFQKEIRFLEELTLGAYNNGRLILESNQRVATMMKPLLSFYTEIQNAELQQFALMNSTDAMKKTQQYQEYSEKAIKKNFQGHDVIGLLNKREKLMNKKKMSAMSMLKNLDFSNLEGSLNSIIAGTPETASIDTQIEELTSQINTMLSTM
jgi:hypothetical protein